MSPSRWQQVKSTLSAALDRPAAERAGFLDVACADQTTVRREVESLLNQTTGGLETCAGQLVPRAAGVNLEDGADPNVGRRVGAWTLGERLGAGGMGAVYLARRSDGAFDQTAAIKLLRRGTDTEEVLRRFRAERQILARLDHPHIARLLDGGATADDDLPFFVLERVDGQPLTTHARSLPLPARLRLFVKICAAVQYAHQNLVIHRDLKPANILVTADGEPKLLDFGIAKLVEDDSDAPHTLAGHGRLTPAYASPEQARGEPVTTASDVYSLGALLYELLAGRSPHRFATARPSPAELEQVVAHDVPPRPSLVGSGKWEVGSGKPGVSQRITSGDASPPTSHFRIPASHFRGDLDNIVLKALEKEPARRYPTVNALAEDIRRHLDGRPVRARPATPAYLFRRFVRRNRLVVAAGTLLLLALLGGAAGTLWQARRAERRVEEIRRLAHSLLFEVDDALARGPTAARQFLVRRALENLGDLAADADANAGLQRELADAYRKVGDVQSRLHEANTGDTAGAVVSYRTSLALRETLWTATQQPADARALAADHGRLGDMLSKTGDTAGALAAYRRAVDLLLMAPAPDVRETLREMGRMRHRLGVVSQRTGDLPGAERLLLASRADRARLVATDPADVEARLELARAESALGYLWGDGNRPAEALGQFRRSHALMSGCLAGDPANPVLRRCVMDSRGAVGVGLIGVGDAAGARAELNGALALAEEALARDPANVQARNDLGDVLHELGDAVCLQPDPAGARDHYRRALEHYRAVAEADPVNVHARRQVAHVEHRLALALAANGETTAAVETLRAARARFEALTTSDPVNIMFRHDLASSLADLAALRGEGPPLRGMTNDQ